MLLDGTPLGVSVTRALGPPRAEFDEAAARALLVKKLGGVIRSTETCLGAWRKQILHVWAPTARAAAALDAAYASMPDAMVSDTVVLVTTCTELPPLFDERMARVERAARIPKGLKEAAHLAALAESDPNSAAGSGPSDLAGMSFSLAAKAPKAAADGMQRLLLSKAVGEAMSAEAWARAFREVRAPCLYPGAGAGWGA